MRGEWRQGEAGTGSSSEQMGIVFSADTSNPYDYNMAWIRK